jgi:murein DD-endopeptidase MepM/ murein hydrolase activator NlpD
VSNLLIKYKSLFSKVVDFNPSTDQLLLMDFTSNNHSLTEEIFNHTEKFSQYITQQIQSAKALYGIGGYNELRNVYARSKVFDGTEPRRFHLGIDIWGNAGTKVFAPLGGVVHSVGYNNQYGDYGATIILQHQLDATVFYTLYGHVALQDIEVLKEKNFISQGEELAHFGLPSENGQWPPHLHFQIILNMDNYKGDYPGVCAESEKENYANNCPDPDIILQMMQFAKKV